MKTNDPPAADGSPRPNGSSTLFTPMYTSSPAVAAAATTGDEWPAYAAGGGAAVVAIGLTFPINKAMFRQQVHGIAALEAVRQLRREGAFHLYRGVLSPLLMRLLSQSVMFGSYSTFSRAAAEHLGLRERRAKITGAVLAGASEAFFMPLERVQVLMQDSKFHSKFRNSAHAASALRVYGPAEYYRGLSAILLRNCPGNVIFFTSREKLKGSMPEEWTTGSYGGNLSDFVCGAFLGALISTCFFPVNVTKTHMQLQVGGDFLKFRDVFKKLLKERGARGMFRGVHINYTRSFLSWGIINVTYENLLNYFRTLE